MVISHRSENKRLEFVIAHLFVYCLLVVSKPALADEVKIAVASNFNSTIKIIAQKFESETDHHPVLVFGSTGKHYAQIKNGAPFDLFVAANIEYPRLLEQQGIALDGSRFTYALGKIVLWSPYANLIDKNGDVLSDGGFSYLAIANPRLAPYGRAAMEVLQNLGLSEALSKRLVKGENIAQAFQFVSSGNAELGFVANSQIKLSGQSNIEGSVWHVPLELYSPIEQQLVALNSKDATLTFLKFMRSKEAKKIIRDHGYDIP